MRLTRFLGNPKALPFYYSSDSLRYVEEAYSAWKTNKNGIHPSWSSYFDSIQNGTVPPAINPAIEHTTSYNLPAVDNLNHKAEKLFDMYFKYAHFWANTNPLNIPRVPPHYTKLFINHPHKPSLADLNLDPLSLPKIVNVKPFDSISIGDLINKLESSLCKSIGYELSHINDQEVVDFFLHEIFNFKPPTLEQKLYYLDVITKAGLFEFYLKKTFPTTKRFGLEGLDSLIVALDVIKEKCLEDSVNSLVLGMAHRGRLNVLCNLMQKPLHIFFAEFRGINTFGTSEWGNTGDVKYHIGRECSYYKGNHELRISLLSNPSHLGFVQPVVCGRTRAKLDMGDSSVVPIIVHGDAEISGEGLVYETVQLAQLPNYTNNGTIHIVCNNQIGFTTYPQDGSSSTYCTDVGKVTNCPILHVNADDVEAVAFAANLALKYRQKFKGDIFLDIIGFRRMGHNELDMPKFTNPSLYSKIDIHSHTFQIYSKSLIEKGVISQENFNKIESLISKNYQAALDKSKSLDKLPENASCEPMKKWEHLCNAEVKLPSYKFTTDELKNLIVKLSTLPEGFKPHPTIGKIFKQRLECASTGKGIDIGLAELLAYSLLANAGFRVRLSGQDTERGTFSHRHAMVHDQKTFEVFNVFSNVPKNTSISVNNSPLNETASLGYEYGYGLEDPNILAIWEAQFGDFANVGQAIIDGFVCSSETKWNQSSAITLLLPHGYDGQGPDHSSCRVERFLQMADDDPFELADVKSDLDVESLAKKRCMSVVNCSTAANLFHVLMRQMYRFFRKPLIVCSGKKLLKLRDTFSNIEDFQGTFQRMLFDPCPTSGVTKLIFCTGQVYYDLIARREELGLKHIAIDRIEQISPFPYDLVMKSLKRFNKLSEVVWCQEEPKNSGCWSFVYPWFINIFEKLNLPYKISYVGPRILSTTSTGDMYQHERILKEFLAKAIN